MQDEALYDVFLSYRWVEPALRRSEEPLDFIRGAFIAAYAFGYRLIGSFGVKGMSLKCP